MASRRMVATVGTISAVALALGGYGTLDAFDIVPGVLTTAPVVEISAQTSAPGLNTATTVDAVLADTLSTGDRPSVQALTDRVAADTRLGPAVSVTVIDEATGEVVGSAASDQLRQPASTAKLVTAVAALTVLDPDSTFSTTAVLQNDRIVLVGGADVMLSADASDPTVVDGRAGLGDLAAQTAAALQTRGLTTVQIGFDDSLFSGPQISPGWDQSYLSGGYVAPITPMEIHIGKTDPTEDYGQRQTDPTMVAARTFADRLGEHGITVTGVPLRTTLTSTATELGRVESATVREVVGYFVRTSDNTVTEAMARMVAVDQGEPATFEGATAAVLAVAASLGADTTGVHLTDASGLASGSALTADLLAELVSLSASPEHPQLRDVIASLPIAGLTGTLHDRYTTADARGLVRAKTGSLPGVTSLAGMTVNADGRVLTFAILADQTPGNQWAARLAIDTFVAELQAS